MRILLAVSAVIILLGGLVGWALTADRMQYAHLSDADPNQLWDELAREHHRGPTTCLRYVSRRPPSELESAADAFVAADLGHVFADVVPVFLKWAVEAEAQIHASSEADEMLDFFSRRMPIHHRLLLRLHRDKVERIVGGQQQNLDRLIADGEAEAEKLDAAQRAELRRLWEQHAPALSFGGGIVEVLDRVRHGTTRRTLDRVEADVRRLIAENAPPDALPDPPMDAWHQRLSYELTGSEAIIWSLGPTGHGRPGFEPELERRIPLAPAEPQRTTTPHRRTSCTEPPLRFATIERARMNRALESPEILAAEARIVPSFEDGQAIGFKLFGIRAGSLYQDLGLCNGDVVTAIDGLPLNSPDGALEAYARVQKKSSIPIRLRRRGAEHDVRIELR